MKIARTIILAAVLGAGLPMSAQVSASPSRFLPLPDGYMERARAMRGGGNFQGTIDQLRHLHTQGVALDEAQAEEYTWMLAEAYYERGDSECLALLMQFRDSYPASPLAPEASMAIGDFYFYEGDWARAAEAYSLVDADRLNRDRFLLFAYHNGYALMNTGHFAEARPWIASLRGAPDYLYAYNFYTAYLDYIDGRFNDAYSRFAKIPQGIKGLDAGYYMAQIEYTRGKYELVTQRADYLLNNDPVPALEPELLRIAGLSEFKLGDYEAARRYLSRYLDLSGPGGRTGTTPEADAEYAMGAIEYADGDYAGALARFEPLMDSRDEIGQGASLYAGQCYLKQNNPNSAALAFEKAYRMGVDTKVTETALYNYVTALTRGGKTPFTSAAELLERFVTRYPDSQYTPEVEAYLATAYYNDRNYTKALKYIDAIRNPSADQLGTRQKILYELGVESMSNGQAEKAVGYLREAVQLRRHDRNLAAQASLWLGDALFSLGRYKEARTSYEAFTRDDTSRENRALGYYNLGYADYKLGDYTAAAAAFASALSARPALNAQLASDAMSRRADCLYYTGKYAEASALFSRAADEGGAGADYALYRRALLHGLAGDNKAKTADLNRLAETYPDSRWMSKAMLELAQTYEEMGRKDLAADAYRRRLDASADVDIDELLRMGTAMNEAGRWDDLLDVTDRIYRAGGLEPDELADISMWRADALANTGRAREAMAIYSQLAENPSALSGAKAAVTLAEIEIKEGDYEAARTRMEEFTDAGTPHQYWLARGFIALADAYRGLGQTSLAREYLSSLEENYPGDEADIKSMISSRLKKWK